VGTRSACRSATLCGAPPPATSASTSPRSRCCYPLTLFWSARRSPAPALRAARRPPTGPPRPQAAVGADGHAEALASPLAELRAAGALPLQPALTGNLVPQQLNLWMGAAAAGARRPRAAGLTVLVPVPAWACLPLLCLPRRDVCGRQLLVCACMPCQTRPGRRAAVECAGCGAGASSGLHHDFHDNLYLLLRGRKRLRLFPPSAAGRMYTRGRPRLVHPNGRIVYHGQARGPAAAPDKAAVAPGGSAWAWDDGGHAHRASAGAGRPFVPRKWWCQRFRVQRSALTPVHARAGRRARGRGQRSGPGGVAAPACGGCLRGRRRGAGCRAGRRAGHARGGRERVRAPRLPGVLCATCCLPRLVSSSHVVSPTAKASKQACRCGPQGADAARCVMQGRGGRRRLPGQRRRVRQRAGRGARRRRRRPARLQPRRNGRARRAAAAPLPALPGPRRRRGGAAARRCAPPPPSAPRRGGRAAAVTRMNIRSFTHPPAAGEALYLPAGWSNEVSGFSPTLTLTYPALPSRRRGAVPAGRLVPRGHQLQRRRRAAPGAQLLVRAPPPAAAACALLAQPARSASGACVARGAARAGSPGWQPGCWVTPANPNIAAPGSTRRTTWTPARPALPRRTRRASGRRSGRRGARASMRPRRRRAARPTGGPPRSRSVPRGSRAGRTAAVGHRAGWEAGAGAAALCAGRSARAGGVTWQRLRGRAARGPGSCKFTPGRRAGPFSKDRQALPPASGRGPARSKTTAKPIACQRAPAARAAGRRQDFASLARCAAAGAPRACAGRPRCARAACRRCRRRRNPCCRAGAP
jgi:hypothetical protein